MKKIIHVNQHIIRRNTKEGLEEPPITVKTYKSNTYAKAIKILDKDGSVVAELKYEPEKPLSCGASLWLETQNEVQIC